MLGIQDVPQIGTKAIESIHNFIRNKKNNSGSISFEYKGLDQLNKIIDIVKANY